MTGATFLVAVVTLPLVAAPGDCPDDAAALAAQADALVAQAGPRPDAAALDAARRLYRRARVLEPSPAYSLSAADVACVAGDEEECVDLLSEAGEMKPGALSAADRLLLARRAESRRAWREAIAHYQALAAAAPDAGVRAWAQERIRRVEVEAEAQAITAPAAVPPPPEARLALSEARRALAAGNLPKARERLALARQLSPGYADAALTLAALEIREGRAPEAIRAYRDALAADPARFEALVGLANLLWDEPDRAAKEEALAATDRALAARPDATPLWKTSALRWAEWGDASRALARLDAYRRRATPDEKRATEALRETLARRVDALLSGRAAAPPEPAAAELSSPAIDAWKLAQAYFRRGDPESLASALHHLRAAERFDPAFAAAPELAGAIHEKRGDLSLAQRAYERAVVADPARASAWERLALLHARRPGGAAEDEAWRRAEQAGSSEAIFHIAESASRDGRRGEALALYRRYLAESPGGVHAEDVARAVEKLEARRRTTVTAEVAVALLLVVAGAVVLWRRSTGQTLEEWIRAHPARAREARPIVGRLRHEVVKHGALLLADAARRLSESDANARRGAATLLVRRLFGRDGARGLVRESSDAFDRLEALAGRDGVRLNLDHRDPLLAPIAKGSRILRSLERPLSRVAWEEGDARGSAQRLQRAAALFASVSGARIARVLDEASSTFVEASQLEDVLDRVCAEIGIGSPPALEWRGPELGVRVDPADWETIWRNLFANALDAGEQVRLGVFVELRRDPVTGSPLARFVLADDLPGTLSSEMIRGRAADRGWGVVADLVRRHEGVVDVVPAPAPGYRKGIRIDLPALEPEAPA